MTKIEKCVCVVAKQFGAIVSCNWFNCWSGRCCFRS